MKKNIEFILTEVFLPHSAVSCRSAFTLAEVLITLGIIGVVAAMTLPSVINDYRHKEFVVRAKNLHQF